LRARALRNIEKTIQALNGLPRHRASGMFHNRYSSGRGGELPRVVDSYLSSVDNIHLAYALWVIGRTGPDSSRKTAVKMLARMDFAFFYDEADGLFHGGARLRNGVPVLEEWKYRYLGSEGRSLYSLAWGLGLIRDPAFLSKAMKSLEADILVWNDGGTSRELLALWDGGAFQLLLPRLLVQEELYSESLREMFKGYARFVLSEKTRRRIPVPASHSACQLGLPSSYLGKAGSIGLVSPRNADIHDPQLRAQWDSLFTPHAAFLAAPFALKRMSEELGRAEKLRDGNTALYRTGLGWMDALHLEGKSRGLIVPAQISLDQAMIALVSAQIESARGATLGARALHGVPVIRDRLKSFYRALDQVLADSPRHRL
jgi:hypothetical protein